MFPLPHPPTHQTEVWLAEVDFIRAGARDGKRASIFMYLQEGYCKGLTLWLRYFSNAGQSAAKPIDVDSSDEKYVLGIEDSATSAARIRLKDNDLRPIIRGVVLKKCSATDCCGKWFAIAEDDRAALKDFCETHTST